MKCSELIDLLKQCDPDDRVGCVARISINKAEVDDEVSEITHIEREPMCRVRLLLKTDET